MAGRSPRSPSPSMKERRVCNGFIEVRPLAEELFEQAEELADVAVDQGMPLHVPACLLAQMLCLILVGQDLPHQPAEGGQIARVAEQETGPAILNLLTNAADGAGDYRPRLPHRFGHGQAEAFLQTLLH